MVIDTHIHVGAWQHPDFLGRASDLDGTLATLRSARVDGAVLMPSDRVENEALLEGMRRRVASGVWAGRLWFFAWVRPEVGDGVGEGDLAWVRASSAHVAGLKLHPRLGGRRITDDAYRPHLELAEELALPVLVHCGQHAESSGYQHALDAAARHPRARFILAHAGGDTAAEAAGAADAIARMGLGNVWLEISGVREPWVIERNIAELGAGRYLLGSDHPLSHPLMYLGAVSGMTISEAERRAILGENALVVLGPPLEP